MNEHENYKRIEKAIEYLTINFKNQPELPEIADAVNLSPFHFQRLFTEWAGISPKRFLQFLTVDFLKTKLVDSNNLSEAAHIAGLSSQSRVYDLFTTLEAVTPEEYKLKGKGINIQYGFHTTPFGLCLIGVTNRGICWLSFVNETNGELNALEEMKNYWNNSALTEEKEATKEYIQKIFAPFVGSNKQLAVLVKGTNFQIKVWEALLKINTGSLATYKDIASAIGNPKALQAVGSAVGANHIAYLIPCHRVIRKDGLLGEYRWNAARKKSIIGWEMSQLEKTI